MLRPRLPFALVLALCCVSFEQACTLEEDFATDPGLQLGTSVDTLRFDTVFAAVGSATRSFKLYNPLDQPVDIASVRVGESAGGRFRINVDGISGEEVEHTFLPPGDSVYVFVEVTVDPDEPVSASPFVFEGEVVVVATGTEQVIYLEAFGQNAVYIPTARTRARQSLLTCALGEVAFDDPRPYVIYGTLIVDSCTLTLPPGARVYVHGGIERVEGQTFTDGTLAFINEGYLNVAGTPDRPVLIATDRLEPDYADSRGAYAGIALLSTGRPHRIANARIRNAQFGVFVSEGVALEIANTELAYHSNVGLLGFNARILARNLIAFGNGEEGIRTLYGGRYDLDYCTFVNYGGRNPAASFTNFTRDTADAVLVAPLRLRVRNSIITGTIADPLVLGDAAPDDPAQFDYLLDHTYLRVDELPEDLPSFSERCVDCLLAERRDTLFFAPTVDSFQLDTLSRARGQAVPLPQVPTDLLGVQRDPLAPDLGAYEYVDPS